MGAKSNPPPQPPSAASVHCMHIQQSGRSVKTMNAKNTKKSTIHENADANITCDFGDGDISRFRSRLTHTHDHIVSSIIVRCIGILVQAGLMPSYKCLPGEYFLGAIALGPHLFLQVFISVILLALRKISFS